MQTRFGQERMHLVVAQQDLLGLAGELTMSSELPLERLLLQREEEGVVVEARSWPACRLGYDDPGYL